MDIKLNNYYKFLIKCHTIGHVITIKSNDSKNQTSIRVQAVTTKFLYCKTFARKNKCSHSQLSAFRSFLMYIKKISMYRKCLAKR